MCKPIDEEYYNKQQNIYSLLSQAYLDKYFLDSVREFKSRLPKEINGEIYNTVFVIAHICDLAKRDLALTLWKVFYDESSDANTVKRLNQYIFKHHGIRYKVVETDSIKKICPVLKALRHGFIAHNLMEDKGKTLQISDLVNALEEIRTIFNELSLNTIDSRVKPLSDAQIYSISFYEKTGFNPLFMSILKSASNVNKEGDEDDA